MPEYNTFETFFAIPLALLICSMISLFILWRWVTDEAFRGFSQTRRKKTLKTYNFAQKLLLFFSLKYNSSRILKFRLTLYYIFAALSSFVIAGLPVCRLYPDFYQFSLTLDKFWVIFSGLIIISNALCHRKKH